MPNTPTYRTRSGSNTQAITYQEMKTLLDNLKTELKREITKLNDTLDALIKRVDETDDKVRHLEVKCLSLEAKIASAEVEKNQPEEIIKEVEQRYTKRLNLIISGVPEQVSGAVEERKRKEEEFVHGVCQHIGVEFKNISDSVRLGRQTLTHVNKPRLLRITCSSVEAKFEMLKKAISLRRSDEYKGIYINPDLTAKQQQEARDLRTELKVRRENGEDVIIRRGKIVNRNSDPHFR
jgi:hypothetical protein